MDEEHPIYSLLWQELQGKEFEKDRGKAKGKQEENWSRDDMRIFCSKDRKIKCQTNHRQKNLKILLLNALVQDELCNDKAGKDVARLLEVF